MITKRIYIIIWAISVFACSNVGSTNNMRSWFKALGKQNQKQKNQTKQTKSKQESQIDQAKQTKSKQEKKSKKNETKAKEQKQIDIHDKALNLIHSTMAIEDKIIIEISTDLNKLFEAQKIQKSKNNIELNELYDSFFVLFNKYKKLEKEDMKNVMHIGFRHETGQNYLKTKPYEHPFNLENEIWNELDYLEKQDDSDISIETVVPQKINILIKQLKKIYRETEDDKNLENINTFWDDECLKYTIAILNKNTHKDVLIFIRKENFYPYWVFPVYKKANKD